MKTLDTLEREFSVKTSIKTDNIIIRDVVKADSYTALEKSVYTALETYSNVHRGRGHYSRVTTHLYEKARDIVLDYLGLKKGRYTVIFCSPRNASTLKAMIDQESYHCLSSNDIGLSLGVVALAVKRKALPEGYLFHTGGGTARLISPDKITWAKAPGRFEPGTPAIINVIAFARALQLVRQYGDYTFFDHATKEFGVNEILYSDDFEDYSGKALLNALRRTCIGNSIPVPTIEGLQPFVNLDNAASTPAFLPVWNTVCKTWRQPSTIHAHIIQKVKTICSEFLNAPDFNYDVIFTSNTTEAINLVAESIGFHSGKDVEPLIVNTFLEHSSNELPWRMARGLSLIRLHIDDEGFIDLKELEALLDDYNQKKLHGKKRIRLVAVSGASNVLGTFNDLKEISRMIHRYGARLLVDAAQLIAHRKVDMEQHDIDYLAFSAHKVYAPFGCGVLVVRKGLLNFSETEMENIRSSGEQNAVGIAALGKSLLLLQRIGMDLIQEEELVLTRKALTGLAGIPGITIHGIKDPESPRITSKGGVIIFDWGNTMAYTVAKELAWQGGIGIRSGCHCAHMVIKRLLNVSPGLQRFQHIMLGILPRVELPGVARISFGIENSGSDIDRLILVLENMAVRLNKSNNRKHSTDPEGTSGSKKNTLERQLRDFIYRAAQKVYAIE